jgi:hypothetical protein
VPPARTLSPRELGKIRWKGHAVFQCLGHYELLPYPKTLILKERSFSLFPALRARAGRESFIRSHWFLHPNDIRPGAMAGRSDLRYVILSRYVEGAATQLVPVSRAAAIQELMTAEFNLSLFGGRAWNPLADLVGSAERSGWSAEPGRSGPSHCPLTSGNREEQAARATEPGGP